MSHTARRPLIVLTFLGASMLPWGRPALGGNFDPASLYPADTLLYVGCHGWEQTDSALKATALGRILAEPQVVRFQREISAALDGLLRRQPPSPEVKQGLEAGRRLLGVLAKRPTTLGVLDAGMGPLGPSVQVALTCHLGEKEERFLKDLESVLKAASLPPGQPVPISEYTFYQLGLPVPGGVFYGMARGHFILAVGVQTVQRMVGVWNGAADSLATSAKVKAARQKIGGREGTRAAAVYLDIAGLMQRFQTMKPMITNGDADTLKGLEAVNELLGLDTWRYFYGELNFAEGGCRLGGYAHHGQAGPASPESKPGARLNDETLSLIPKHPTWAHVTPIDGGEMYRSIRSLMQMAEPSGQGELSRRIKKFEERVGLALDKDLFDLLEGTLVMFDAEDNGGLFFTGLTVLVESSNPDRLTKSLQRLVQVLDQEWDEVKVEVASTRYRDHSIRFINVIGQPIPVAPAWAVRNKRIIFALYPQMVMTTLDRMLDGNPQSDSLLGNADFARAGQVLGGIGRTLSYVDTRKGVSQLYSILLPLAQVGAAMGQGQGVPLDISTFPSQAALTRHLFAHVSTTKVEEGGVMLASYGPLPVGVPMLAQGNAFSTPLLVSILLPSLARARELSKRTVSAANLRGIGMACQIYAAENDRQFPPDLPTLVQAGSITEKLLHAPVDPTDRISYIYLGGQSQNSHPLNVLAHERMDLNNNEGVNVLFVDGHVEFVQPEEFQRLLQETKARLAGG